MSRPEHRIVIAFAIAFIVSGSAMFLGAGHRLEALARAAGQGFAPPAHATDWMGLLAIMAGLMILLLATYWRSRHRHRPDAIARRRRRR